MRLYFPEEFPDSSVNIIEEQKRRALLMIKIIKNGENPEYRKLIKEIDEFQLSLMRPYNFDSQDPENYVKAMEVSFENVCTSLEELGVQNPGDLTVFQFYTKIAYFKKKNQKK